MAPSKNAWSLKVLENALIIAKCVLAFRHPVR